MANLLVRNVEEDIAQALKERASLYGINTEAEHRRVLEQALKRPKKRTFLEALVEMPDVGRDEDFERHQGNTAANVFD